MGPWLGFLMQMPSCSEDEDLQSGEIRASRATISWSHCPLDLMDSVTVQLGLAEHESPRIPLPGLRDPLSLEHPSGVSGCSSGPALSNIYTIKTPGLPLLHGELVEAEPNPPGM